MIGPADDDISVLVEDDERGPTVRLPAGVFRPGDRVRVRREPDPAERAEGIGEDAGGWVPPHVHPGWPPGFWEKFFRLPAPSEEFERAVREAREEMNVWPERPWSVDGGDEPPGDGTTDPGGGPGR